MKGAPGTSRQILGGVGTTTTFVAAHEVQQDLQRADGLQAMTARGAPNGDGRVTTGPTAPLHDERGRDNTIGNAAAVNHAVPAPQPIDEDEAHAGQKRRKTTAGSGMPWTTEEEVKLLTIVGEMSRPPGKADYEEIVSRLGTERTWGAVKQHGLPYLHVVSRLPAGLCLPFKVPAWIELGERPKRTIFNCHRTPEWIEQQVKSYDRLKEHMSGAQPQRLSFTVEAAG